MKRNRFSKAGFTLAEMMITLAIAAIAIPVFLAMFTMFANQSVKIRDRDDLQSIVNRVTVFLEEEISATTGDDGFSTVFQWIRQASQDPSSATTLYVYYPNLDQSSSGTPKLLDESSKYTVSLTPPLATQVSKFDARIACVEIHSPHERILPKTALSADVSEYKKAYLPFEIHIYALGFASQERGINQFLDSFPIVLFR
ncbi:MAG: prepilin-type N-terminal cleavage/methylation domain-containing protein [Verrucomicrobiota bacterium]